MATTATATKTPAAAPATPENSVTKLAEQVKNFKEQQEATRSELMSTREEMVSQKQQADEDYQNQLAEIDGLLAEMGSPVEAPVVSNGKPAAGRGSGPRGGNTVTIAGGVEQLLLKYKKGLTRPEITVKMDSEIGYKNGNDDPTKYTNNIYTGGIVKLMKDGKIIPTGERPGTIYKHVNNANATELAAYKAKKAK